MDLKASLFRVLVRRVGDRPSQEVRVSGILRHSFFQLSRLFPDLIRVKSHRDSGTGREFDIVAVFHPIHLGRSRFVKCTAKVEMRSGNFVVVVYKFFGKGQRRTGCVPVQCGELLFRPALVCQL